VVREANAAGEALPDPSQGWTVPQGILASFVGAVTIYAALFGIGYWLYGRYLLAAVLTAVAVAGTIYVTRVWGRLSGGGAPPVPEERREVVKV
jgi:hypothetical protein